MAIAVEFPAIHIHNEPNQSKSGAADSTARVLASCWSTAGVIFRFHLTCAACQAASGSTV